MVFSAAPHTWPSFCVFINNIYIICLPNKLRIYIHIYSYVSIYLLTNLLGRAAKIAAKKVGSHENGRSGKRIRTATDERGHVAHLVHNFVGQASHFLGQIQLGAEAFL